MTQLPRSTQTRPWSEAAKTWTGVKLAGHKNHKQKLIEARPRDRMEAEILFCFSQKRL